MTLFAALLLLLWVSAVQAAPSTTSKDKVSLKASAETLLEELEQLGTEGKRAEGCKGLNSAVLTQPKLKKNEDIERQQAWCAFEYGRLNEAEQRFRALIKRDGKSAEYTTGLAMALSHQDQFKTAEPYYRRALTLEPGEAAWQANYCEFFMLSGRMGEAKDCARGLDAATVYTDGDLFSMAITQYCLDPFRYGTVLARLKLILERGYRDTGIFIRPEWLVKLKATGHPDTALIEGLVSAVRGERPLAELDQYPRWKHPATARG